MFHPPPQSPGVAQAGAIRRGAAYVEVRHDGLDPRPVHITIQRPAEPIRLVRRWPEDFEVRTGENGHVGAVVIPDIQAFSPFSAVQLTDAEGRPYAAEPEFGLHSLCAFSSEEALAFYAAKPNRPQDVETQFFAGQQMRDHYFHDLDHRKFVAVFFAYRGLDLGDPDSLKQATDWVEAELYVPINDKADHFRSNRDHLKLSMLTVLWHLHLAAGDYAKVVQRLDEGVEVIRAMTSWPAFIAYNGCRMILLRAYLHGVSGAHAQARELGEFNLDYYKRSAQTATLRAILFKELGEAHHAVFLGLEIRQSLERKGRVMKGEHIFKAVNRIRTEPSLTHQRDRFDGLLDWARMQRA
jgi:hypothetical protein